jgi:hypothetical protein
MPLDWITEFKPAQSDGTLPVEGSAGAMRYRRAVLWQVDLSGFGIGGRSIKGSWEVTITSPSGSELFHQVVEVELFFVYLSLPGIAFYTWNFVKDDAAGKATTLIDGKEVGEDEMEGYLMLGLRQSAMEPSSGQGNTDFTAFIAADWLSPGYLFPAGIPAGSKVTIKRDTWGFGPASVEYSWAFGPGEAVLDSLIAPTTGQTFLLHIADGDLKLARTRRGQPTIELREIDNGDEEEQEQPPRCDYEAGISPDKYVPSFARLYRKNGALYCVAASDDLKLFRSDNDGQDWKELASMPAENLNITISACAFDSKGSTLTLYGTTTNDEVIAKGQASTADNDGGKKEVKLTQGKPMFVVVKNQGDTWKVSARGEVKDGDAPKPADNADEETPEPENELPNENIAGLEYAGGRFYLTVKAGENGLSLYYSDDGLRSLKKLKFS